MFALKVRYGVLTLGLIFILGWVGLISVSNQNLTYAIQVTLFNVSIPLFNGHPAFFWGTILHVAVSGKHYFGIATTNYWRELFAKQ